MPRVGVMFPFTRFACARLLGKGGLEPGLGPA